MLYIDKENAPILFVKNPEESNIAVVNMIISLTHELVHFGDYIYFCQYEKVNDLRKLQDNNPFLVWTEFHATYVSILYAINHDILVGEFRQVLANIKENSNSYCDNNKPLRLESTINYLSRVFGECLVWKKKYDVLPQYPQEIIVNMKLVKLCKFFIHITLLMY